MILKTTYCAMCNKEFIKTVYRHIYCGNAIDKTGCAYNRKILETKKWKEKHPDKLKLYNYRYRKNNQEEIKSKRDICRKNKQAKLIN